MKARLVPIYFPGKDINFDNQLANLKNLLADDVDILDPVRLGASLPKCEAALFPQMLGRAYHMVGEIKALKKPLLVITSEFGTVLMWDWEICSFLRAEGLDPIAPNSLDVTRKVCKTLGVKRDLENANFLVFQDDPGEGMQPDIFKRFYWFEPECIKRIHNKFGVKIVKRSFEKIGAQAKTISDAEARIVWEKWQHKLNIGDLPERSWISAIKVYMAVKKQMEREQGIAAVGINCLNESRFSDTTPCLAWNMLYEEEQMIWGCEADIVSMLTKYILHKSLGMPIMMTNIYPFLMGQAALKHERIPDFPGVENPDDHILVAHCGYLGVVPQSFATEWTLRKKVLAIVDENATAIDARLPEGKMTLVKLHPTFQKMTVAEGELTGYVQYPNSDCLNGGILRVSDGHKLLNTVSSHHYLLMSGHHRHDIEMLGKLFGLEIEVV